MSELDNWLKDIKETGRPGWVRVYMAALARPISNPTRFFRALDIYGQEILFEALVITSTRVIKGDPLAYLLTIAQAQAHDKIDNDRLESKRDLEVKEAKAATDQQNNELAQKLKRAKELSIESTTV